MRRLLQIIFFLMIPSWLMAAGWSVSFSSDEWLQQPDSSFYDRYSFIRFAESADEADMVRLTDDEFLDEAGRVEFRVNRYDVLTNDSLLRLLDEVVIPQIRRDGLHLLRMILRGAASPEGPFDNNRRLGQNRVKMLSDFMRERLDVSDQSTPFNTEVVIEDYRLLCAMMRRAGDPDYALVQELCDRYLPIGEFALLKTKLRQAKGGRLWWRLLKTYFPELRATRLVLIFEKYPTPETVPEEPVQEEPVVEEPLMVEPIAEVPVPVVPVVVDTIIEQIPTIPEPLEKKPRREVLAIKSNLLFDFAYVPGYNRWCPIPNIALEFFPLHGHFTYGFSFDCPWWQHYHEYKFFQIRNYQLEARYYFRSGDIRRNPPGKGAAFRGFYLQAYTHLGLFGICFDENRGWVGEGLGAGIGLGYVLPLSRKGHWRLEFAIQAGFFACKYDPYQYEYIGVPGYEDYPHDDLYYYKYYGDPDLFKERQYRFSWFGPTRVGITLSYDLLYRRIRKKGASFRSWEKPNDPLRNNEIIK